MTCKRSTMEGIRPDGFTGALLACESILDGAVILHGPTGCRGHHSAMSEHLFPRDDVPERLNFLEPFYFGQPRIPTTFLDGDDFVFGAREKLVRAIGEVMKHDPSLVTVVNSPGAALIGDNVGQAVVESGLSVPCAAIDMPALSCSLAEGYEQGLMAVLEALCPDALRPDARTVALIGLSIGHQHWAGSVNELRRLLSLCGIRVVCAVGAGSSVEEYRQLSRAACYATVHDEYANRIGPWLTERYEGVPASGGMGAPLGFPATAAWVEAVARAVDADPTPALEDLLARRRRVARLISQATGSSGVLRGMTCAVCADPSIALPLVRWLHEYLGMYPVAVETPGHLGEGLAAELFDWLSGAGCADAWQIPWYETQPDLFFGDGGQVAQARAATGCGGVEIMLPAGSALDIMPKAMLGATGAEWLMERVLRELRWALWV